MDRRGNHLIRMRLVHNHHHTIERLALKIILGDSMNEDVKLRIDKKSLKTPKE